MSLWKQERLLAAEGADHAPRAHRLSVLRFQVVAGQGEPMHGALLGLMGSS
jgi:hypothetical protein